MTNQPLDSADDLGSSQHPSTPKALGHEADNLCGLMEQLIQALNEYGCTLEWIKLDNSLWLDGSQVTSLMGVNLRDVVFEDEATHWRHTQVSDLANTGSGKPTERDQSAQTTNQANIRGNKK